MAADNFKIVIRGLFKSKQVTITNLIGLSLGITCFLFMLLYIANELSYDRYHGNAERLYRLVTGYEQGNDKYSSTRTPAPLAEAFKSDFPSIEEVTRLRVISNGIINTNNQNFREELVMGADPSIFRLFTFPFISGDANTALLEPNTAVITESIADKYFGNENPLNKEIKVKINDAAYFFTITGIIKEVPLNSHFHFRILVSNNTFRESKGPWNSGFGITYFLLKKGSSINGIETNLQDFIKKHVGKDEIDLFHMQYQIQKVTDIHLYSHCRKELETNGNVSSIYIFSTLALLIFIITCINYINLSTAKSEDKAKEIGLRKVFGAAKWSHVKRFFIESGVLCFVSFLIAIALVSISLNLFENKLYKIDNINLIVLFPAAIIFIVILSVIAGIYPALYFTPSRLNALIKNERKITFKGINPRNILVALQVAVCIGLTMFTIVIYKQHQFIEGLTEKSFEKDNILIVNNIRQIRNSAFSLKENLVKYDDIEGVTVCNRLPCKDEIAQTTCSLIGSREYINVKVLAVDKDYLNTLNIKGLNEGRFFSDSFPNDSNSVVINKKALSELELKNALGKQIRFNGKDKTIIGIIEDFNYEPVFGEIEPLCIILSGYSYPPQYLALKIKPEGNIQDVVKLVKSKWESYTKEIPFEYSFFSDDYLKSYESINKTKNLAFVFLVLTIIISVLGLSGLIAFISEKRTKEIGIRKVNGARVSEVLVMLNCDFVKWVAIAFVIATPIAYYAMNKWLEDFAYKTTLSWWIFALAGLLALGIALLTVSWQSWRAATRNPVEALRYE
jgi:putative ABC transport system permease protein